jgi:hypothetical protein
MSDATDCTTDGEFKTIEKPTEQAVTEVVARVARDMDTQHESVTDNTGSLCDLSVYDLGWVIARGSVSDGYYSGGSLVVTVYRTTQFKHGEGSLDITIKADRESHEIESVNVAASLY